MEGTPSKRLILQATELLLWSAAALCFSVCGVAALQAYGSFRTARLEVEAATHQSSGASQKSISAPSENDVAPNPVHDVAGTVIGRLEIPELALAVPMTAGIETTSLLRGVGHIEGTAQPGGLGTLGLAGHRDTYFRPLRRIAKGMDIRVIDRRGVFHYQVDSTEIVMPEQVDVLAIRQQPELTLVTCYPFDYIGAAPKRFIVHAHLLSAEPDRKAP